MKTCFRAYDADSENPDQPAHPRSLIRAFTVCSESPDTTECMNGEQRPGWYFAHAQDGLNANFVHAQRHLFALRNPNSNIRHIIFQVITWTLTLIWILSMAHHLRVIVLHQGMLQWHLRSSRQQTSIVFDSGTLSMALTLGLSKFTQRYVLGFSSPLSAELYISRDDSNDLSNAVLWETRKCFKTLLDEKIDRTIKVIWQLYFSNCDLLLVTSR